MWRKLTWILLQPVQDSLWCGKRTVFVYSANVTSNTLLIRQNWPLHVLFGSLVMICKHILNLVLWLINLDFYPLTYRYVFIISASCKLVWKCRYLLFLLTAHGWLIHGSLRLTLWLCPYCFTAHQDSIPSQNFTCRPFICIENILMMKYFTTAAHTGKYHLSIVYYFQRCLLFEAWWSSRCCKFSKSWEGHATDVQI